MGFEPLGAFLFVQIKDVARFKIILEPPQVRSVIIPATCFPERCIDDIHSGLLFIIMFPESHGSDDRSRILVVKFDGKDIGMGVTSPYNHHRIEHFFR